MGGSSSTLNETDIRNEISNEIGIMVKTHNENVTKIINETSTSVMSEMVDSTTAKVQQSDVAVNTITAKSIIASGKDSSISIKQAATVKATSEAVIKIMKDQNTQNKLADNLVQKLVAKMDTDNDLQASLAATTKLSDEKKKGIGDVIDNAVNAVKDVMKSMSLGFGAKTDETTITRIRNEVKNKMNLSVDTSNINKNEIARKIETSIKNSIKNMSDSSCVQDTLSQNQVNVEMIAATGGGVINLDQTAVVESAKNCIIEIINSQKLANEITKSEEILSQLDATTKNKIKAELKAESTIEKKVVDTAGEDLANLAKSLNPFSAIGGLFSGLFSMIAYVIGFAVIAVVGFFIFKMINKSGGGGGSVEVDIPAADIEISGGAIADLSFNDMLFFVLVILIIKKLLKKIC